MSKDLVRVECPQCGKKWERELYRIGDTCSECLQEATKDIPRGSVFKGDGFSKTHHHSGVPTRTVHKDYSWAEQMAREEASRPL